MILFESDFDFGMFIIGDDESKSDSLRNLKLISICSYLKSFELTVDDVLVRIVETYLESNSSLISVRRSV